MSEPRAEINFTVLRDCCSAASGELSNIEQSIRYRYWGDAIEYAEKMKELMDGLIAEFRKGV
jgi:hypothetical protein